MKNIKTNKAYRRSGLTLVVTGLLCLAACFASCSGDDNERTSQLTVPGRTVTITMKVPGAGTAQEGPATYALPADEDKITSVDVLCFRTDPSFPVDPAKGTFLYRAAVSYTAGADHFSAIISDHADAQTLVVVTNCRAQVDALMGNIAAGEAKLSVIGKLLLELDSPFIPASMTDVPMWGEITNVTVNAGWSPGTTPVGLTRMLAKINITNNDNLFDLRTAYLYNPRKKGSVIPDNWNGTAGTVNAATVVSGAVKDKGSRYEFPVTLTTDQVILDRIYTFEADNAARATADIMDATALVVGGYYNSSPNLSYYRVDLMDYSKKEYYDVKRNHLYEVTLTSLGSEGSDTAEKAFEAKAVIEATVTPWNLANAGVILGTNRMRVSKAALDFPFLASSAQLSVFADYPGGWKVEKITDDQGQTTIDWLTLTPQPAEGPAGQDTDLTVETQDNGGLARTAFIHIKAGNMTMKVRVNQAEVQTATVTIAQEPAGVGANPTGGGSHIVGTETTVSVDDNSCYTFVGWYAEDDTQLSTARSFQYTVTGDVTLTAKWTVKKYTVTLTNDNAAQGTLQLNGSSTLTQDIDCGSKATLKATPATGYIFNGWYDSKDTKVSDAAEWNGPTITAAAAYTAKWTLKTYAVSIAKDPSDGTGGNVTVNSQTAPHNVTHGSTATLAATVNTGFVFDGWYLSGTRVSTNTSYTTPAITAAAAYTAKWTLKTYAVSIAKDPSDGTGGNVTVNSQAAPQNIAHGSTATLAATVNTGFVFDGWYLSGTRVSTNSSYTTPAITATAAYTAKWTLKTYAVSIAKDPSDGTGGNVTVNSQTAPHNVTHGSTATLAATVNTGFVFDGWYLSGTRVSTNSSYTTPAITATAAYTAKWEEINWVTINGVRWAKYNLAAPQTFESSETAYGMYYQFGRGTVAWSTTGLPTSTPSGSTWISSAPGDANWELTVTNDPCPGEWTVPTRADFDALVLYKTAWTTNHLSSGVMGWTYTDGSEVLFLPAAGYRSSSSGALDAQGTGGYYWSSSTNAGTEFSSTLEVRSTTTRVNDSRRAYGYTVRCVRR